MALVALAKFLGFTPLPDSEEESEYGTPLKLIPKGYWEHGSGGQLHLVKRSKGTHVPCNTSWAPIRQGWLHEEHLGYGWSGSTNILFGQAPKEIQPWVRYQVRLLFPKILDDVERLSGKIALTQDTYRLLDLKQELQARRDALQRIYDYLDVEGRPRQP